METPATLVSCFKPRGNEKYLISFVPFLPCYFLISWQDDLGEGEEKHLVF